MLGQRADVRARPGSEDPEALVDGDEQRVRPLHEFGMRMDSVQDADDDIAVGAPEAFPPGGS